MKKTNLNKHIALVLGVSAITAASVALTACGAKKDEPVSSEAAAEITAGAEIETESESIEKNVSESTAESDAKADSSEATADGKTTTESDAETDSESAANSESSAESDTKTGDKSAAAADDAAGADTPAESSSFANAKLVTHSIIAESLPENFPGDQPVKAIGGFFFEGDQPALENVNGDVHEELLFLNYDENCLILDANEGYPVDTSVITEPVPAVAYISQAMTMSLPPQTNPELILVCTEGGCTDSFPYYVTITDNTLSKAAEGSHILSTTRGDIIVTSADTEIIPYRTKQVVVIDAITEGTDCIVWLDNDMIASKIMVFAK